MLQTSWLTETEFIKVTNDLLTVINVASCLALILMYFSSAFNTADHLILLEHLQERVDVTGPTLEWLKSCFLTVLSVKWSNPISSAKLIALCTQGYILGHFVFGLYLCPLDYIVRNSYSLIILRNTSEIKLFLSTSGFERRFMSSFFLFFVLAQFFIIF